MKGPVDDRGDHALGIVIEERLFKDGLPGSGFAPDQIQATLLGMHPIDGSVGGILVDGMHPQS